MNIVAIDPGKTCGVARLWWLKARAEAFDSQELPPYQAVNFAIAEHSYRADLVVCESFTPRPGVRTWQPDALETIGALRYACLRAGIPFETQSPADAKRFATNAKLHVLGWRNPTPGGHADDAARHLLLAAVRHSLIDPAIF